MPESLAQTRDEFFRLLGEAELPASVIARLTAQARPALLLTTTASEEADIPLGASKLGGAPDLPRGVAWPLRPAYPDAAVRAEHHRGEAARMLAESQRPGSWLTPEQGQRFSSECLAKADAVESAFPLAFFGQFDLGALSGHEGFDAGLPAEGRLLIFYDFWEHPEAFNPEASTGWRVIWDCSPAADLARLAVPDALTDISSDEWRTVFRPARVEARTVFTPMPLNEKSWDAFLLGDGELVDTYADWLSRFGTPDQADGENHQLGGFPRPLQNGLQARNQLAANGIDCGRLEAWDSPVAKELLTAAVDWQLVLQIGVDEKAGMPGPGAYYVMMRKQDMAARCFDLARITYQCD